MGGKGGGSISVPNMGSISIPENQYENRLAAIANQMFTLTGPLRQYSLEDLGTFMRGPQGATPWTTGASPIGMGTPGYTTTSTPAATTAAATAGTTGGTVTSNYTAPSYNDIYRNLKSAYTQPDYAAAEYLRQMGEGVGGKFGIPLLSTGDPSQVINPEFDPWLKSEAQRIYNDQLAKGMQTIANQQAQAQTAPVTTTTTQQAAPMSGNFVSKDLYNPYNLPAYAPLYQLARTGLESQYNPARENILASTPRGGALYENLANLEMNRAQQAGALPASIAAPIIQDLYNKAYGVAWQTPQTSISGLSGAEQGLASRYGSLLGSQTSANNAGLAASIQQQQLANQSTMGLGAGLGSLLGMGMKGLTAPSSSILGGILGVR